MLRKVKKIVNENYSASDVRNMAVLLSKLRTEIGIDFCPEFAEVDMRERRVYGAEGKFERLWSTSLDSDGSQIGLSVIGEYANPGAQFQGRANLLIAYDNRTSEEDLGIVRLAARRAGLEKAGR